jgi:hypothetical protein
LPRTRHAGGALLGRNVRETPAMFEARQGGLHQDD